MVRFAGTFVDPGAPATATRRDRRLRGSGAVAVPVYAGAGPSPWPHLRRRRPDRHAVGTPLAVTVVVTDDDTGVRRRRWASRVRNVALDGFGINVLPGTIVEGTPTGIVVTVGDVGLADSHTVTVNWGDGSTPTSSTTGRPAAAHRRVQPTPTSTTTRRPPPSGRLHGHR